MTKDLNEIASLEISLGHLIYLWETISNEISGALDELCDEEKRAIWAMEDLLEKQLIRNGFSDMKPGEWEKWVEKAKAHMSNVSV